MGKLPIINEQIRNLDDMLEEIDNNESLSETERAELKEWTINEAMAMGVSNAVEHWVDENPQEFTKEQRASTTIWQSGLTWSHDLFVGAALRGIGYHVKNLPVPDNDSLRFGKEFGNRGQCNPTYFTVGNLIKHLKHLEASGIPKQELIDNHLFVTAGACGPCRFGTYVTEYRKALRDAGFEGFRVMLFQQQGGLKQATGQELGLEINRPFFQALVKAFLAGDVLNLMGYRIRPYEVTPGATDEAVEESRRIIMEALENQKSVLMAMRRCRKVLEAVEVDKLQPKPIVSVIGEFWAMTTEGDGNYELQKFLESEGAEVAIQPLINWILFILWEQINDTRARMELRGTDDAKKGLEGTDPVKKLAILKGARIALLGLFKTFAAAIGLKDHHLPDMDHIADLAHEHYDNELRGGEGHMEVGKLIDCVEEQHAHMVISVKPFGCMPSSGVSDGVQSLIQSKYPEAIFLPIETSGDGRVNVESRVQMMLFKAHKRARSEFEEAVSEVGLSVDEIKARAQKKRKTRSALYHPAHNKAGTGANMVYAVAG